MLNEDIVTIGVPSWLQILIALAALLIDPDSVEPLSILLAPKVQRHPH